MLHITMKDKRQWIRATTKIIDVSKRVVRQQDHKWDGKITASDMLDWLGSSRLKTETNGENWKDLHWQLDWGSLIKRRKNVS